MSVSDLNYPGNAAKAPRELRAPATGIRLWWCELGDASARDELASWLSPAEHARAARFASSERAGRYVAGRAALRWILGQHLGVDCTRLAIERGERGRPRLADASVDFNVSNTRDVAFVAVCDLAGTRVGVDVEHVDRQLNHAALSRKFLTMQEQDAIASLDDDARRRAFLRYWTYKEAMSKATGEALSAPLRRLDVSLSPLRLVGGPAPYDPRDWTLSEAAVPSGFIGALALWRRPAL